MKNATLFVLAMAACISIASAQRPWIRMSGQSAGAAGKVTTVSNALFLFDTVALLSYNHGAVWDEVQSLDGTVCALSDFTLGLSLAVTFDASSSTARCYFSFGGTAWTKFDSLVGVNKPVKIATIGEEWYLATEGAKIYVFGTKVDSVSLPGNAVCIDLVSRGTDLVASTRSGVFFSSTAGATWTKIAQDGIGVLHTNANNVYATSVAGVLKLNATNTMFENVGQWQDVATPPMILDIDSYSGRVYCIAKHSEYQAYWLEGDSVWTAIGYPLPGTQAVVTSSVFTIDAGYMIVNHMLTSDPDNLSGVYVYDLNDFTGVSNEASRSAQMRVQSTDNGTLVIETAAEGAAGVAIVNLLGEVVAASNVESAHRAVVHVPPAAKGLLAILLTTHSGVVYRGVVLR